MLQATEYHLGQLKAKLAKLRTELQAPTAVSADAVAISVQLHMESHTAHQKPSSCPVSGFQAKVLATLLFDELKDCCHPTLMMSPVL